MKKKLIFKNYFWLLVFLAMIFFNPSFALAKNQINNFTIRQNNDDLKLIFELNDFPKYRVFITSNFKKLVIDFQDSVITKKLDFTNQLFKSSNITKNSHGDLRIIINLNQKILIDKTTIINPDINKKYQVEIDLEIGKTASKANKNNSPKKIIKYHLTPLNSEIADKIINDESDSKLKAEENKFIIKNSDLKVKKIKSLPIIIIDAGHGGKDPGTIGDYARSKEKNVTLAYAKELKKLLDNTNKFNTFLTRDGDYFIALKQRVEKSRKLRANLFISLHADSSVNKSTTGLSIYTLSERSSDKQAEILAQKENKADIIGGINFSGTSGEILNTLINLSQRNSMNNSAKFAEEVIKTLQQNEVEILQNTHRFAGFRVLTAPDVAAVLIELGYLSNKYEENKLNSLNHRKKITESLVKAIEKYFTQVKE